jgi:hypothetical protein
MSDDEIDQLQERIVTSEFFLKSGYSARILALIYEVREWRKREKTERSRTAKALIRGAVREGSPIVVSADLQEYLKHVETMLQATLCVCGHRQDNHSRDDDVNNPDPGEPCSKCDCFTFRPTFYREGEK